MSPPRREIRVGNLANRCNSHTSIIEARVSATAVPFTLNPVP
jgi:hypothetical protein